MAVPGLPGPRLADDDQQLVVRNGRQQLLRAGGPCPPSCSEGVGVNQTGREKSSPTLGLEGIGRELGRRGKLPQITR